MGKTVPISTPTSHLPIRTPSDSLVARVEVGAGPRHRGRLPTPFGLLTAGPPLPQRNRGDKRGGPGDPWQSLFLWQYCCHRVGEQSPHLLVSGSVTVHGTRDGDETDQERGPCGRRSGADVSRHQTAFTHLIIYSLDARYTQRTMC